MSQDVLQLHKMMSNMNNRYDSEWHDTLLSDEFYNKVKRVVNGLEIMNFEKIKCIAGDVSHIPPDELKNQYCMAHNKFDKEIITYAHLDFLADVMDKYEPLARKLVAILYRNAEEAQRFCGKNPEKIMRLKKLISRFAVIFVDDETLRLERDNRYIVSTRGNKSIEHFSGETRSMFHSNNYYIGWFVLIIFCVLVYYLYKCNHSN